MRALYTPTFSIATATATATANATLNAFCSSVLQMQVVYRSQTIEISQVKEDLRTKQALLRRIADKLDAFSISNFSALTLNNTLAQLEQDVLATKAQLEVIQASVNAARNNTILSRIYIVLQTKQFYSTTSNLLLSSLYLPLLYLLLYPTYILYIYLLYTAKRLQIAISPLQLKSARFLALFGILIPTPYIAARRIVTQEKQNAKRLLIKRPYLATARAAKHVYLCYNIRKRERERERRASFRSTKLSKQAQLFVNTQTTLQLQQQSYRSCSSLLRQYVSSILVTSVV